LQDRERKQTTSSEAGETPVEVCEESGAGRFHSGLWFSDPAWFSRHSCRLSVPRLLDQQAFLIMLGGGVFGGHVSSLRTGFNTARSPLPLCIHHTLNVYDSADSITVDVGFTGNGT
jgi:hypothetical protein